MMVMMIIVHRVIIIIIKKFGVQVALLLLGCPINTMIFSYYPDHPDLHAPEIRLSLLISYSLLLLSGWTRRIIIAIAIIPYT